MRLSIFTRIIIGYLAVFIPVMAICTYAIWQLVFFHLDTGDILQVHNRLKDLQQKLVDSVLMQERYERKYIFTKDEEFLNQFVIAKGEVGKQLGDGMVIADTAHKKEVLSRAKDYFERYNSLFDKEMELSRDNQGSSKDEYKEEKEKALNGMLAELRKLEQFIEQDTYEKMRHLQEESGAKANMITIAMAVGFIFAGIMISILITKRITGPISFLREKTRKVATGNFEGNLKISSPPEIEDLARDFNFMCEKLGEMDKIKSDFFSLMAHELRTPIASIKEGSHLLLQGIGGDFQEKPKTVLRIIAEESNRLANMVNSLLDFSKMEAGMMALQLEKLDIRPLIHQAVSGIEPLAMAKKVNIRIDLPEDLPWVQLDGERILQALRNLVENAVKFTPEGGQVTISSRSLDGMVNVSVADTGPGIPSAELNIIFDKFKQATLTRNSRIKGTGLGLAIVKHIINAHGGKVWVESEPGHGSTFIFQLPS